MKKLGFVFAICAIASCSSPEKLENDIIVVTPDKELSILSDSSYLGQVMSMDLYNNRYVLSDYKSHKVIFLDKNLDVLSSVGSYGKGPGDLNGPIEVVALQDSIFIFEEMNQRVSVFDWELKFSRHINNVFRGSFSEKLAISADGNALFCSRRAGETPLQMVDLQTLESTSFGAYMKEGIAGRKPFEYYHFVLFKDWIFAIANSDPVIRIYDKVSLELVNEVQYENAPIVKGAVDYIADQRLHHPSPNKSYVLVQDVAQYKNHLYMLIIGRENGPSCNHIAEFCIDGSAVQLERIFALDDGQEKLWYSSFLADEDCFLAYSAITGGIQRFIR